MIQLFYNIQEAALFLALKKHEILYLIRNEKLPVCFYADTDIKRAIVERPDGTVEHIDITIHIAGTLKSFYSGKKHKSFDAVVVDVLAVDSQRFSYGPGCMLIKGHKLPTVDRNTGFIQPGYVVSGVIDSINVKSADWLLHIEDLARLRDGSIIGNAYSHEEAD